MNTTKAIVISVILVLALVAGVWAFKAGMLPFLTVTSQIDIAGDIIDKTYDADNAIYNYEWFKQRYEDIQATETKISNTKKNMEEYRDLYGDASEWDWQTKQGYNSLNTVYLGQQNYYEEIVADYNARSKMANREIFKEKLPLHVDKMLW